ncbi:MAG: hypothetical protein ACFFER_05950 [Candidatus Thorarchaeota archaeon]
MNENGKDEETTLVVYEEPLDGIKEVIAKGLPENIDLRSLFYSPEGKRFANQVQSQKEFTLVGILFPMLIELFVKIYPKLMDIVRDVRFKSFYKEQITETEEIDEKSKRIIEQIPDMIELMLDSMDEETSTELETGFDTIFGSKAKERFLGNMVFSLHSYLQAYVDSIIESLVRNEKEAVRKQFLEYWDSRKVNLRIGLLELDETSGDKYDAIIEIVKRSLTSNPVGRMHTICKAIDCDKQLKQLIEKLDGKITEDELRFLYDQRNRIAHGDPAPELKEYGLELEQLDWAALKESLIEEVVKVWPEAPEGVFAIIELACVWAEKIAAADYFVLLDYLPKTVLTFPAIFDYVINDAIKAIDAKETE